MSQKETLVNMACTECENLNYQTRKNKTNSKERLELNKFCKKCRKSTAHKETK